MPRINIERQRELEPKRVLTAKEEIQKLGFKIIFEYKDRVDFIFKGERVMFFPYSGWHTGKSIKDGRGLKNLLKQLKP